MESILKSFSISFLLRGLFAGAFFVIAYRVSGMEGTQSLVRIKYTDLLSVALPIALLAGVTIYSLHRSLVFPWIEWGMNSRWAEKLRKCIPLISRQTIKGLRELWYLGETESKRKEVVAQNIRIWADYTHLLYTSFLCIPGGSLARRVIDPCKYDWNYWLVGLAAVFFLGAVVSDWRLHSVREGIYRLSD